MNAAAVIANRLAAAGCKHAFGMPGGEVLALLDALRIAGIDFTLVKHENAGGYMAEGSWQATGAPGILLTTIGPGLANAVNSVANAYQEQVPLIVLTGCISHSLAARFTHQVIDQAALLAPVTKATLRVDQGIAALTVQKALSIALADPPGPVLIELPDEYLHEENWQESNTPIATPISSMGTGWDTETPEWEKANKMLRTARKPVILAGLGAVHHQAGEAIWAFAEKHQIPVITTYKAKGIIPEDHPLSLGGHGLSPLSDKSILPLLATSDCVILAGYDPIEMRDGWIDPWAAENAIEIMHAPNDHGMHNSAVRLIGNVGTAIAALAGPKGPIWTNGDPNIAKAELAEAFAMREEWGPHQIFRTLNECIPEGGIVTVDSGAHRILLSQMWRCKRPNSLLQSSAFCTMGVAIPLAIGYKKAAPNVHVAAVVGDAGFDMTTGDLATLRDLKCPMAIVVPVDESLSLIEKKQTNMQLKTHGVTFTGTDIPAVARAYGGVSTVVNDKETLRTELELAWQRSTFTVLACPVDKAAYNGSF